MKRKKVLVLFGTRPDTIKVAPVLKALQNVPVLDVRTCVTAQHRALLDQMLHAFRITPDYDLDIMQENQSPDEVMQRVLRELPPVLQKERPDLVMVHGDTTTAAASGLAAFHQKIPVAHIEAGLRSYDIHNPYPEELNRVLIDHLSSLHLAPTLIAKNNLSKEGIPESSIFVTGNTAVDAIEQAARTPHSPPSSPPSPVLRTPSPASGRGRGEGRILLVTLHRRESFGKPLAGIFGALKQIVQKHSNVAVIYPVHLNPQVAKPARRLLRHPRIFLSEPLSYLDFVHWMKRSHFILTDSGGIQEEAPSLRKPVLVLRNATERPELIQAGGGLLLGTDPKRIAEGVSKLLQDDHLYKKMSQCPNPYGDGKASQRIASAVKWWLRLGPRPRDWRRLNSI